MKLPGPDHPITVTPATERIEVRIGDTVVADTTAALALHEADYPVTYYVPISDVDESLLSATATTTHCPYKGDASYYSVTTPAGAVDDAIWYYPQPYPAVGDIKDHVAFYANKVDIRVS